MKSNGLSSVSRTLMRTVNRKSAQVTFQEKVLAAKEKQKAFRLLAEKAIAEKRKKIIEMAAIDRDFISIVES